MNKQNPLLEIALKTSVPLYIQEIKQGKRNRELTPEQANHTIKLICEDGDQLLYGGKRNKPAEVFNHLSYAVACLAFESNGITIFGIHFQADKIKVEQDCD